MEAYVENLLAPISVDDPSGPDLVDAADMMRIEELAKGVPEDPFKGTPAEPPDWRKLRKECETFLGKSKHLKVAVILSCALLKMRGLSGFKDGLQVLLGLTRDYWDAVHPRLDPTDANDPTQRLNIIGTIKLPRGLPTDWMLVMNHLYEVPLAGGSGRVITLAVVDEARRQGGTSGPESMSQSTVETVIRATPAVELQATLAVVKELKVLVELLDQTLTEKVGTQFAESFGELTSTLARMIDVIEPFSQGAAETDAEGGQSADDVAQSAKGESGGASSDGGGGGGPLRSRDDIVRQLELMCAFLEKTEPSSPVPLILRRAQKMIGMNFLQVMNELSLATSDSLKPAMGSGLPAEETPS